MELKERREQRSAQLLGAHSQFRVAGIQEGLCNYTAFNRKDYFKISLLANCVSELQYGNQFIKVSGPALVLTNPLVPYSWSYDPEAEHEGYFCVFTAAFLQDGSRVESLQHSVLFKTDSPPVYPLEDAQLDYLTAIFKRMRAEADSQYTYKNGLIRSQVDLILHEAIKMRPGALQCTARNAAERIAGAFLGLLAKQFPVGGPRHPLRLKKAGQYAEELAVHVNHLNAVVQDTTGKSTTAHIHERILAEAKSLLAHTSWSIAEIAASLGFESANYFNNFFKKHTHATPMALRKVL